MDDNDSRTSIPIRVGLAAVAWGLLLLMVWAIHPIEGVASVVPVENPSPEEQASIDRVMGDGDATPASLIERFECDQTPLQAATGASGASAAPTLEVGFAYEHPPCSREYGAAQAAFWVNLLAVAAAVAISIAFQLRSRNRGSDDEVADGDERAAARAVS